MYVGMPENRLSLTVIESDGKAIPPIVIMPGGTTMKSWFHENMTGHEVVTVSPSGYISEEICIRWLDHFIKHNDCGPDKPWRILLMDATCHGAPEFILIAKMNRIWIVKVPFASNSPYPARLCGLFLAVEGIPTEVHHECDSLARGGIQRSVLLPRPP